MKMVTSAFLLVIFSCKGIHNNLQQEKNVVQLYQSIHVHVFSVFSYIFEKPEGYLDIAGVY